ncbi:MAG: hypothetical protein CSA21_04415 [Deltaproteobacteria bacterium]|nr:MAG: hypothetical protein CSA21_04415 [Deltaproteobacteria bacterium]
MIWIRILFGMLCILNGVLAVQLIAGDKGAVNYLRLCRTRDHLAGQVDAVTLQNVALSHEIRLLKKSPVYNQQMAKAAFNLAAQDEILYLFELPTHKGPVSEAVE